MKKVLAAAFALALVSCSGGTSKTAASDSAATASDTITNVTNPGVGAVSDDTARH